jgi:hypothetical protein
MNTFVEVAVPPGVVTAMAPVVAPVGTVKVMVVPFTTVKPVITTPFRVTEVAPVKLVPVSVTTVPTVPIPGVKDVMVGAGITVKLVAEVAVPVGVAIVITPVVAVFGTVAVTCVAEFTKKVVAALPLNATCEASERFVPVMTTTVPTGPMMGVKLVIVGGTPTVNGVAEVAVPAGVVTVMVPVVVPAATVAVIWVAEFTK